jgi:hypothetical protein
VSEPPVYSSPRSRQLGTPHLELHTPNHYQSIDPFSSALCTITHLIEIKHQIQLTHIAEECIQYLHEEMYSFQVRQLVIVCVNACAEEEAGVTTVYDLGHVTELDEVGLVFLVARGYEAVNL